MTATMQGGSGKRARRTDASGGAAPGSRKGLACCGQLTIPEPRLPVSEVGWARASNSETPRLDRRSSPLLSRASAEHLSASHGLKRGKAGHRFPRSLCCHPSQHARQHDRGTTAHSNLPTLCPCTRQLPCVLLSSYSAKQFIWDQGSFTDSVTQVHRRWKCSTGFT